MVRMLHDAGRHGAPAFAPLGVYHEGRHGPGGRPVTSCGGAVLAAIAEARRPLTAAEVVTRLAGRWAGECVRSVLRYLDRKGELRRLPGRPARYGL